MILMVTLIVGNSGVTALASSGADADTGSHGIKTGTGGSGGSSSYKTTIHRAGGGYKISIVAAPKGKYAPTEPGEFPLYTNKAGIGKTAMSINGTTVVNNHKEGVYGIAPIYLVGGWKDKNEFAVDTSMKFDFREDTIKGREITEEGLKRAVAKENIKDKSVADAIFKAFNQTNIFSATKDINTFLKMTPVTDKNITEEQRQRNADILNTILNLTIEIYKNNATMHSYLQELQNGNMKEHEVIILIEPMAHISMDGKGSGYITPANYVIGITDMKPSEYVEYANFTDMRNAIGNNFKGTFQKIYGLYDGTGGYVFGSYTRDSRGDRQYSTAIGNALGGHNPVKDNPILYRESLFGKVIYSGPLYWDTNKSELIRSNKGGKWGHGTLASSDFLGDLKPTTTKSSSASMSILGQKSGITPNISMGLTTTENTEDAELEAKVTKAIQELDKFANDNKLTLDNLEQYLSSGISAEILEIIINKYDEAYLYETSMSNKQEDIQGRIKDILDNVGLQLDSLYIARYMNMLIKNGENTDHGFTFNTEVNKELIKYLYTMFIPEVADGYRVLNNIEKSYRGEATSVPAANTGNSIMMMGNSLDTSPTTNMAKVNEIVIFGGVKANVTNHRTTVDYKYSIYGGGDESLVDGNVGEPTPKKNEVKLSELLNQLKSIGEVVLQLQMDFDDLEDILTNEIVLQPFEWETYNLDIGDFEIIKLAEADYDKYLDWQYWYSGEPLSEKEFYKVQKELKKEFKKLPIELRAYYADGKSSNELLAYAKRLAEIHDKFSGYTGDSDDRAGIKFYFEAIDENMVSNYKAYKDLQEEIEKYGIDMSEQIELYHKDKGIDNATWIDDIDAMAEIIGASLGVIADELGESVSIWVFNQYRNMTRALDINLGSNSDTGYLVGGITDKVFGAQQITKTSVDMGNAVNSIMSSSYLSDFSKAALVVPELEINQNTIGLSSASTGINAGKNMYYSPIISVESMIINDGYYGVLTANPAGSFSEGNLFMLDTAKQDLEGLASSREILPSELENIILQYTLNYPTGSLYAMSDEIQLMLSDYINDCVEYADWYWSDKNTLTTKSVKDLNEKFSNELQYRVGMYLDIIKDTRTTAEYYNMLSNKEAIKGIANTSDNTVDVQPDYKWVWDDKANLKGHIERAAYYANTTNEDGLDLKGFVLKEVKDLKGLNTSVIEKAMTPEKGRLYYPNIFGTTLTYLSEKSYKFNYRMQSAHGTNLYVGGAFQYPLSYVTCNVDNKEFGMKPKVGDTCLYSVYSLNLDVTQNSNYFERYWPTETSNGTVIDMGRVNNVYNIGDIFIDLLKASRDGGLTTHRNATKSFYSIVDANATNPTEAEGSIISVSSAVRGVLGIADFDLESYRAIHPENGDAYSLANIIGFLSEYDQSYATKTANKFGSNSPKIVDAYVSEEMIALTQYLFENIVPERINDGTLRKAFSKGGEYYELLIGNGGFESVIGSILTASTTDKKYSWVTGLESKLIKGVEIGAYEETDADKAQAVEAANKIYNAYKNIMASMLSDAIKEQASEGEYANNRPMVAYVEEGISYGSSNSNTAGGLLVNNEVFKYYVENMIALSSITKNLTAVYIADDGEVSDSSLITSLGGAAVKYEYINNLRSRLEKELENNKTRQEKIQAELKEKEMEIKNLDATKDSIQKEQETASQNLVNTHANDKDIEKYTKMLEELSALKEEKIKLEKEFDELYALYKDVLPRYHEDKAKMEKLPEEIKKYQQLVRKESDNMTKAWNSFRTLLDESNRSLPSDLKSYAIHEDEFGTFLAFGRLSIQSRSEDSIVDDLKKHYGSNIINAYEDYAKSASKVKEYQKKLKELEEDSKIYNSRAISIQGEGVEYAKELVNKKSEERIRVDNKIAALEEEIKALEDDLGNQENNNKKQAIDSYKVIYNKLEDEERQIVADMEEIELEAKALKEEAVYIETLVKNTDALLGGSSITDGLMLNGEDIFVNDMSYADFLKENGLDNKFTFSDGTYIFNLTYWEYEDADSGAVIYLPGNSNAILNPAKLNTDKGSTTDNNDDRTSKLTDMKAFGSTAEEIALSMDSIASLSLQRSARLSENLQLFNFIYRNGSWPVQAVVNNGTSKVATSNVVLDQDIPIDAQIIEVDNNGTILKYHDLIKNFASMPSHVMSTIDITESFQLGGVEVEVQHIALVPTVEKNGIYELPDGIGKNIINALQSTNVSGVNILDGLGIPGVTSYLQPMSSLEYTYKSTSGTETIKGKYLAALTKYDRDLYANDSDAHPIMVLLVKVKEPIKQLNVIENYGGNTAIEEVIPNTNDDETEVKLLGNVVVKDSAGNGLGTLQEWVILNNEDVPENILTWSDIPLENIVESGTDTLAKPIEGGQTVVARYTEGGIAALTGDLILEQNEITKKYALSDYDGGNLEMLSTISAINDTHAHDLGRYISYIQGYSSGSPIYSVRWLSNWKNFKYSKVVDNIYEHSYGVKNEDSIDEKVIIKVDDSLFKPIIKNNTTGRKTVGMGGTSIILSPDYDFLLWRGYDIPTLASFKNSSTVINELSKLGIGSGKIPNKRIIESGLQDNKYTVNIEIGKDVGDYVTVFACAYNGDVTQSQKHDVASNKNHQADAVVRTYAGNHSDIAKEQGKDNGSLTFNIDGQNFNTAMGFVIPNNSNISFYPYVKMTYENISGAKSDAYVLSTNLRELNLSDYVDIGYSKSAAMTLNLESNQWSNHKRSTDFLKANGITDRHSVLPGGATYTLDTSKANVYVGLRTWQTVLPTNTIEDVQTGAEYFSDNAATARREDLVKQISTALESYDVVQYIAQGIIKNPSKIADNGVLLANIASGRGQTVFGNQLSTDAKYYLKTKSLPESMRADEADLDIISSNQVRQTTYTIMSDTDGKVWVEKNGLPIVAITKTQGINELLLNKEIKELDDRTRLVTNYLAVIDRNKGDVDGERWYNEAWDGLSVIMTEYTFEVGFKQPGVRTSVLDPKLVGKIESKSDIYNFKDATKVRSSIFRTAINNNINGKPRWVATWGDTNVDIILKGIENMLISKPFYVPNATVQDLN